MLCKHYGKQEGYNMAGLITKIFVCPITVVISAFLFTNVDYAAIYQPIIVGLVLAVAAHMMEVMILRKGTLWMSTVMDFIAATLIVYFVSLLFAGAAVSFLGAVLTAILISITEYFEHQWLIKSGRTEKSPA